MTLYTQAAAPAPLTIMAVPLTLSAATVDSYDPRLFGDNVVALAGDAGFRTYWLSNQARLGRYDTSVTAMANMAHFKTWADAPYDEALLPLLDAALAEPGRKVVFLHINGNHDNYCTRYPETATVYQGGAPYEDCYDNSIRYVDALLGAVMDRLRERRASCCSTPTTAWSATRACWARSITAACGPRARHSIFLCSSGTVPPRRPRHGANTTRPIPPRTTMG